VPVTPHVAGTQNEVICLINPANPLNVVAVWNDWRTSFNIGVSYSTDGGLSWQNMLLPPVFCEYQFDPILVVDQNGIFSLFSMSYNGDGSESGLIERRSSDGGRTWPDSVCVVHMPGTEDKEMAAIDTTGSPWNGTVYVAWTQLNITAELYLTYRRPGGAWSPPRRIGTSTWMQWPFITVGTEGELYLSWISLDGGATWRPAERISSTNFHPAGSSTLDQGIIGEYIGICARGDHTVACWTDTRAGLQDIYAAVIDSVFDPSHTRDGSGTLDLRYARNSRGRLRAAIGAVLRHAGNFTSAGQQENAVGQIAGFLLTLLPNF
jgi:hypothetical protein